MSFFSGLHRFISFGPRRCRAQPEHFLHQIKASPFRSSLSPHPVMPSLMCFAPSFQLMFGILSKPSRTPTCSWHVHVVAASSASRATRCVCCRTPLRAMLLCFHFFFVHRGPLLFGLGLELFTILSLLHQTAKLAACCNAFSPVCWTVLALIYAMTLPLLLARLPSHFLRR